MVYGNSEIGSLATGLDLSFSGGSCINVVPGSYDASDMNGTSNRSMSVSVTGASAGTCSIDVTFSASNAASASTSASFIVVIKKQPASQATTQPATDSPTPVIDEPTVEKPTLVSVQPTVDQISPTLAPTSAPTDKPLPTTAPPESAALGSTGKRDNNLALIVVGVIAMLLIGSIRWKQPITSKR